HHTPKSAACQLLPTTAERLRTTKPTNIVDGGGGEGIMHPVLTRVRHNQDTNSQAYSNSIDQQLVKVLIDPDHHKINSQGEDSVLTAVLKNMDPSNFVLRSENRATTASVLGIFLGSVVRPA